MSLRIGDTLIGRPLTAIEMGLLAAVIAAALCRRKDGALAAGLGGLALGEAIDAFMSIPEFAAKWVTEQFDAALQALENWARSLGLDLIANAFGQARSLFNQFKEWAEGLFGRAGQMLLAAILIYLVYSRFFLRR